MTSAVAVVGLTYASADIQTIPGLFLEIVLGLNETPSVRGVDTVIPTLAGRVPRARIGDTLHIELRGFVAGAGIGETGDRAAFATLRQTVRTLFSPTRAPADLVAALEDGSIATISARPLPTLIWDQIVPAFAHLSVELESTDPDWVIEPAGS